MAKKLLNMTFKNPWGQGSGQFNRWMKNNPWGEGGKYYNSLFSDANPGGNPVILQDNQNLVPDYIIAWLDKVGYKMFTTFTSEYGYTDIGALLVMGHANKEKGWGERSANERAWTSHNWWNVAPRESKAEVACSNSRWACFTDLDEAISHYDDWMNSTPDLIAFKNPNFNPSYPEFGKLLKSSTRPTADQISDALRLDNDFPFCTGDDNYSSEVLALQSRASRDLVEYLSTKIDETKKTKDELGVQITENVANAHKPMTDEERTNIDLLHARWVELSQTVDSMSKDLARATTARTILN